MLSGIKFIPRDQIDVEKDGISDKTRKKREKSSRRHERYEKKNKHSSHSSSDELEQIKFRSRKQKKWNYSDEELSSFSDHSGSQNESELEKKHRSSRRQKKGVNDSSDNENRGQLKNSRARRKEYSSEDEPLGKFIDKGKKHQEGVKTRHKDEKRRDDDVMDSGVIDDGVKSSQNSTVRKEMGLEWMLLQPKGTLEHTKITVPHMQPEETADEKVKKDNPRELNPYFRSNGSGYPEEIDGMKAGGRQLLASAVGDGGASWRLKALKRAQEQASREGRKLQDVVEERWGSMGEFASSLASHKVAPTHAHLHAIKNRRKGSIKEELESVSEEIDQTTERSDRKSVEDAFTRHSKMRVPKVHNSLSWGRQGLKNLSAEDTALVHSAMSSFNNSSNDRSVRDKFIPEKNAHSSSPCDSSHQKFEVTVEHKSIGFQGDMGKKDADTMKPAMSANQLAAKAMQLRMKGKHEEAEKLLNEVEKMKMKQDSDNGSTKVAIDGITSRYILNDVSARQKKKEEDSDLHLAKKIIHNNRYSILGQADEEYDYDGSPKRKARKKGGGDNRKSSEITSSAKRFLTQQDRCQFCFENPTRPKHLVIAIANFTYLSLPQMQPVVPGHCYILTLQHESSTRAVDDTVWDEIRNFKKCLILMFSKQELEVVFLETVMGLAQQKRHCLVECVPLPKNVAKQAPVYFKKAIDEAEDEWSQHDAKKLIDTSIKGLRNSIPKNFPYFHVEFGLNKGFAHVIDNEKDFKSTFGLNIIRGMLQLPAEDMHRRWKHESLEKQKQGVASFSRDWEPFDWTKQLS